MAALGFEEKLWQAADKMRNNMDPAEYKHIVLGLIFLKYISDSFEEKYNELVEEGEGFEEDRDEYTSENIFWVPKIARWENIKINAKKTEIYLENIEKEGIDLEKVKKGDIGNLIDIAMVGIEKENKTLKGVLNKNYGRPDIDKTRLGELIDIISEIKAGDKESRKKDILGRVYEYFLGRFAGAEGKGGGEFYTPKSIVKTMVEMIEPFKGRVYDPACGSGGMFVQSESFVEGHQGKIGDISVYGQESNPTTWRLCKMNLAIRGIEGNLGQHHADSFHNDMHKTLKADYILANPPFNISDWGGEKVTEDIRWKYGTPPNGNANYAWLQHMIHHLSPNGVAGVVLANGSLSSNTSSEGEIRKNMVEDDLVDCIIAMPSNLFYSTGIPVCIWFLNRNKSNPKYRERNGETLFIDARKMGEMVTRKLRELTDEDIKKISETYHKWRGSTGSPTASGEYEDIKGYCKSVKLDEIKEHEYILTPGRYVGIEEEEEDGIPFEEKMGDLTSTLGEQFSKSRELEERIRKNLASIGFEV